jgi:hypothetical protein
MIRVRRSKILPHFTPSPVVHSRFIVRINPRNLGCPRSGANRKEPRPEVTAIIDLTTAESNELAAASRS